MTSTDKINFLKSLSFTVISENLGDNLQVKCDKCGQIIKRPFSKFKSGVIGCPKCKENDTIKEIESYGLNVIEFINGRDYVVKCKNNHIMTKSLTHLRKTKGYCKECEIEKSKKYFLSLGYTDILPTDNPKIFSMKCKNGHSLTRYLSTKNYYCDECKNNSLKEQFETLGYTFIKMLDNHYCEVKCKEGHLLKRSTTTKTYFCDECETEQYKNKFGNFKLLGIENKNGRKIFNVECKNGHKLVKTDVNEYCPKCEYLEKKNYLNNIGLELLEQVEGTNSCVLKCKNGHTLKRNFSDIKLKGITNCPVCNPHSSSFENEIKELLPNALCNDYSVLGDKELDFYLPKHNLAIECNGDYWHSDKFRYKNYHLEKLEKCKLKGIHLIQITESSWNNKKNIWKSIISGKLGLNTKIFARKCEIRKITSEVENNFLNDNHLLGGCNSSICYGLFYNDELVELMSFRKCSGKYDWENTRLCSKCGITVVGGASKLLNYFRLNHSGTIVTYADRTYSNGNVYEKIGMNLSHISKPSFVYVKSGIQYNRQQFMKHKLKDKLEFYDEILTESENMNKNGYYRLWDCGKLVYTI